MLYYGNIARIVQILHLKLQNEASCISVIPYQAVSYANAKDGMEIAPFYNNHIGRKIPENLNGGKHE
jgi:hypothetical protein